MDNISKNKIKMVDSKSGKVFWMTDNGRGPIVIRTPEYKQQQLNALMRSYDMSLYDTYPKDIQGYLDDFHAGKLDDFYANER